VYLLQTALELRMSAALEAGQIELMLADLDHAQSLLSEQPTAYHSVVQACLIVPWRAAQGRFDEAEARLLEASLLARGSQLPWAGIALGSATVGMALWQGQPSDDGSLAEVVAQTETALPTARLLLDVRRGDLPAVRGFLTSPGVPLTTDDFTALFHLAVAAEASYVVGDADLAAEVYAGLVGHAGQVASAGTGIPLGPVDAFLALAAATIPDPALASRHADDAVALMTDWGLEACAAWFSQRRDGATW
jgi:hypothetical protein